jgi:hypothetical protein
MVLAAALKLGFTNHDKNFRLHTMPTTKREKRVFDVFPFSLSVKKNPFALAVKLVRKACQRFVFPPVSEAHTNKFYIF